MCKRRALIHQSATAGSSMPPNFTIASACLILSFIATQRILLNCPDAPRRVRVLPDLRETQSRTLLPRQGRKDLRPLLRYRAGGHHRLPSRLFLSCRGAPLRRRASALPGGHAVARRKNSAGYRLHAPAAHGGAGLL